MTPEYEKIMFLSSIFANELGYLEKASNRDLYSKTANAGYNNYTKYWAEIAPQYQGQPWCAGVQTWGLQKAWGQAVAKKMLKHYPFINCEYISKLFTLHAKPKLGSLVIFYRNGEFAHVGFVKYVGDDQDYFETYEGNTSAGHSIVPNGGGFYEKSYYNHNLPGTKFIYLDYDLAPEMDISDDDYYEALGLLSEYQNKCDMMEEEVRKLKENTVYNTIDEIPDFARPIVAGLVKAGIIYGVDDSGNLGLSYKELRHIAISYRGGAFDKALKVVRNEHGDIIDSPLVTPVPYVGNHNIPS